jgi:hypothetical protein
MSQLANLQNGCVDVCVAHRQRTVISENNNDRRDDSVSRCKTDANDIDSFKLPYILIRGREAQPLAKGLTQGHVILLWRLSCGDLTPGLLTR